METSVTLDLMSKVFSLYIEKGNKMKSKIKIFESGIIDGVMSRNKKFYSEEMTQEEITKKFLETRIKLGKKYGFNGKKIFQAFQKSKNNNIEYKDGTYHIIKEEDINNKDLWYVELPADILIISENFKNIVVGSQMADCPIIIIEDRRLGVTALSHCGASYINRYLPKQTAEALIREYHSNPSDLYVYIGSCAKKESYIYDRYPGWATNKSVWKEYIIKNENNYNIDMPGAIIKQLKSIGIKNIALSSKDTITDEEHYSHSASSRGNARKNGQNFVGFYYL